jgi:hypothetical protein
VIREFVIPTMKILMSTFIHVLLGILIIDCVDLRIIVLGILILKSSVSAIVLSALATAVTVASRHSNWEQCIVSACRVSGSSYNSVRFSSK